VKGQSSVWSPLFFSVVLIVGMVLGFNLRDSLRNKRDFNTVVQRNDRLEELIGLIQEKYVDTVNTNTLYEDAVEGLLSPLDPHTVYIPADELQSINNDLDGVFSGVGIEFFIVHDTVEVTAVNDKGPAAIAGITTGDQLIKVNDSLVAGNGITSEKIMRLLRGKKRSTVQVTVHNADSNDRTVTIARDIIPIYSVEASIMADEHTGYIKISRFSATTYDEFSKAVQDLKERGATQLILDVRDNPGGYLDAATSICDDFIAGEKLLVSTQGRRSGKQDYKSGKTGLFENGRLVVLINEHSASASEILAGAVQDWDRGVIAGRRSFGKGLVQEQYEMPDGSALRLTIARYYTPSGRSIQRSFSEGRDAYREDMEERLRSGELTGTGEQAVPDSTVYHTHAGRTVYGGGGITPDIYVPYDTTRWSTPLVRIAFSDEMRTAVRDYYLKNRKKLIFKDIADFIKSFRAEEQVINNYLAMLPETEQRTAMKHVTATKGQEYVALQVKAQLARYIFRDNGYYSVRLKDDNVMNRALAIINSDSYNELLKKPEAAMR